jgi:hypothetical protein
VAVFHHGGLQSLPATRVLNSDPEVTVLKPQKEVLWAAGTGALGTPPLCLQLYSSRTLSGLSTSPKMFVTEMITTKFRLSQMAN